MKPLELKGARTRLGYSQRYMANKLGICEDSYRKKERGLVSFSDKEKILIVNELGLNIYQFNVIFYDGKLPIG